MARMLQGREGCCAARVIMVTSSSPLLAGSWSTASGFTFSFPSPLFPSPSTYHAMARIIQRQQYQNGSRTQASPPLPANSAAIVSCTVLRQGRCIEQSVNKNTKDGTRPPKTFLCLVSWVPHLIAQSRVYINAIHILIECILVRSIGACLMDVFRAYTVALGVEAMPKSRL